MAERRIMKNQTIDTDYTDEKFKIGERNYYLYSDLDSPEFHVVALYESSRELLAVIHKKPCTLPGIKAVFESKNEF